MGGAPDAGVSCVETGCVDTTGCLTDGMCEPVSGECVGRTEEPIDTPCGRDEIFVCDGEGRCVGCNVDAQCDGFFPERECLEEPQCIEKACPPPDSLPDGTLCSSGECRSGVCSSPWSPIQKLVPMACGSNVSEGLFDSFMDLTVDPTPIMPAMDFSASIAPSLLIPQALLQRILNASLPTPVPSIEVTEARGEIISTRVSSGTPVNTTLVPLPQTVPIPQAPNEGDLGGQACDTDEDCPLTIFGQRCSLVGECECACQPGCVPAVCASVVTDDLVLPLETIQGAIYGAFPTGPVCFDVGGDASNPDIELPIGTGIRVSAGPTTIAIECEGGVVNDGGTPDMPDDDFVDPNSLAEKICFPIEAPEPSP